MYYKQKFH